MFAVYITDSKNQEEMLIAAREKAMESDKLKMAFLADMSHEIRTLYAITGFSRLLETTGDDEKMAKYVESNNRLLLQLIDAVFDIAQMD